MCVLRWCASSASRVEVSNPAQAAPAELGASVPSGPTNNTLHRKLRMKPFSATNSHAAYLGGVSAVKHQVVQPADREQETPRVGNVGHLRIAPPALSKTQVPIAPSALCRYCQGTSGRHRAAVAALRCEQRSLNPSCLLACSLHERCE